MGSKLCRRVLLMYCGGAKTSFIRAKLTLLQIFLDSSFHYVSIHI